MSSRGFRSRSLRRDSETDQVRFDRVIQLVRNLRSEIHNEYNGLKQRHSNATISAASAQAASENEGNDSNSERIDELTREIIRYPKRLEKLDEQLRYFQQLEKEILRFKNIVTEAP